MRYVHSLPASPSFASTGLSGYILGPLNNPAMEVCYLDVTQGHDTYQISREIIRIYYVLSGTGYFTIAGQRYDVTPGVLIEVPVRVEYSYSGRMELLMFGKPRGFSGNDTATKWNPDVVPQNVRFEPGNGITWTSKLLSRQIFGKSPMNAFLRFNRRLWERLPSSIGSSRPMRFYGGIVHKLARLMGGRAQGLGTCFLRNRPTLELIRRLADRKKQGETFRVAILGCSAGSEVYSIAWSIRSLRPDLKLHLEATDISSEVVEFAKSGVYPIKSADVTGSASLERMTTAEVDEIFDRADDAVRVKPWIREGINWNVGDVGDPRLAETMGTYDIVVANNFLCHMDPRQAERCLRNIAPLVKEDGHLFVSGVDLNVRTRVARDLKWIPVEELLEDVHNGDIWLRRYWPHHYTGLEPLDKNRSDWKIRYAAVFKLPGAGSCRTAIEVESATAQGALA